MKINRRKRARRIIGFYKSSFGFREPYQVLVDGTFCKAALQSKVNLKDQIPQYLDGEVKLLTTFCAVHEMETLGPALYGVTVIIKQFPIHKCGHEKNYESAAKCFKEMVGKSNESHYIVATQDHDLKTILRNIPGTPIIYLHYNAPVLEKPSGFSEESAEIRNNKRVQVTDYQKSVIDKMKSAAGISEPEIKTKKRKRKGGPNPLSCKKKTLKKDLKPTPTAIETAKKTRKRVRVKIPKHVKQEIGNKPL